MTLQKRVPENFRSCRRGAEQRVSRAQTRERGPPLALAEINMIICYKWSITAEIIHGLGCHHHLLVAIISSSISLSGNVLVCFSLPIFVCKRRVWVCSVAASEF